MLKYTGHPLVDVGIATLTAFAEKRNPSQVTEADLDQVADYITREYVRQPLKSFLTVAFTTNAWFSQDAYNPDKPKLSAEQRAERRKKRQTFADAHLRQWNIAEGIAVDVFTGYPSITKKLSKKLTPGKAARAQIPLTLGDSYINFFPNGSPGLTISGLSLLALQAFPLGCAKCGGKLLAVHSDNEEVMLHFAKTFLEQNRRAVTLAQAAGSKKMPEAKRSYRTLLIETLLEAERMRREAREEEQRFSITAYHLSNSGQGAELHNYYLPTEIINFLYVMEGAGYSGIWHEIVYRAWEVEPKQKRPRKDAPPFEPRRNWLYEDLFELQDNPEHVRRFLRTYFLRLALRYARGKTDPRVHYSLHQEVALVSWKITAEFLRRIMNMDKDRIEQIRTLGDNLAAYIGGQNDRRFFRQFFTLQRYGEFRTALIKANLNYVRSGHAPIITLDPYITVFEEGDELARPDWRLARDLVLIRMIEHLYQQGWLGRNADAIPESTEDANPSTE